MKGVDVEKFKTYFASVLEDFEKENKHWEQPSFDSKGDDVDLYNEEKERSIGLKLKKRNVYYIKKVRSALQRIEQGQYGECAECGDDISEQRLIARPTAHLCIRCKEEEENGEKHLAGRAGHPSLKKEKGIINIKDFQIMKTDREELKTVNE